MKTIKVKDLMSISGKGGLYRFLAQARNGIVVESLAEKKRWVAPPTARVSSLDDIAIFSENEDVPLCDVMMKLHEKENGGVALSPKASNEELKTYFREVLPEFDEERVYVSDIKKVLTWYNQLQELELLEIVEKEEEKDEDAEGEKAEAQDKKAEAKDKKVVAKDKKEAKPKEK